MRPLPEGLRPGGRFEHWRRCPPRYVVADVDGTLVGDPPEVTARVAEAVRACAPAGLPVGIATGRMPAAVASMAEELGMSGPHVFHNGAQVVGAGEVLASWPLPGSEAVRLASLCEAKGLYAEFYVAEGYLVTDTRPEARRHWELMGCEPDGMVSEVGLRSGEVAKATILLFDHTDPAAVLGWLTSAGLAAGSAKAPVMPDVTFVNVTSPQADKGRALRIAAEHVGCELTQVVAIGDGLNDLPMMAVAGTAIAMGQSEPQVLAAAHLVVPEVGRDGVAHALRAALGWVAER